MRHVALLRAVNVAGRNAVTMAGLRDLFEELGFAAARTLLQSGNVVFEADGRTPPDLERVLEERTAARLGVETDYFVRTSREWSRIVAANPFPREAREDPARLVVVCLKKAPSAAAVEALRAAIPGRETIRTDGRHAYIVYPDGQGRSKLTPALIERKLGARGTARNWNTVVRLASMLAT